MVFKANHPMADWESHYSLELIISPVQLIGYDGRDFIDKSSLFEVFYLRDYGIN